MPAFTEVMHYLPLPIGASVAGSASALLYRPRPTLTSALQHFAAGAVLAGVAVELVPDLRGASSLAIIGGWLCGLGFMLLLRQVVLGLERAAGDESLSLVYVAAVDVFIDGFLFSVGFGAGHKAGVILAVALSVEAVFLAMTVTGAVPLSARRRRLLTPLLLAGLLATGAVVGALLLSVVSGGVLTALIAFGAVALLYLVVEELLVEAHETAETPFAIAMFFTAFLLLLLLEGVL